jgi:co-chaperonin GroES (HSP10)
MNPATIKPSRNRLLIHHQPDAETVTHGIILPQNTRQTHGKAKVIAIGSDIPSHYLHALVLAPNYSSPDIIQGSDRYTFIHEHDLLAVLPDDCSLTVSPPA